MNSTDKLVTYAVEPVKIPAADGYLLGGSLFRVENNREVIIVHGATAVPHQFYRRFAYYLQQQGVSVVTYDFRGVGASAPENLKTSDANCSDWGLYDIPAVLQWVKDKLAPEKIYFVGHSVGGQQAGLLEDPQSVDAMATVCAQSGYWRLQGGLEKYNVFLQVYLIIPLLVRLVGYLPWSKFAKAEDLPAGVALQWASWCRNPQYLLGDKSLPRQRYKKFTAPVLAYSIEDDNWGTTQAVDAMTLAVYPNVQRRHIVPTEYALAKLGHLGFFRRGSEALWQQLLQWLQGTADSNRT